MKRKNKLIILVTFIALIILGIYLSWDKIIAYLHAFEKYKKITEENVTIEDLNIDKEEAFRELTSIDHNDIEYKNTNNIFKH